MTVHVQPAVANLDSRVRLSRGREGAGREPGPCQPVTLGHCSLIQPNTPHGRQLAGPMKVPFYPLFEVESAIHWLRRAGAVRVGAGSGTRG